MFTVWTTPSVWKSLQSRVQKKISNNWIKLERVGQVEPLPCITLKAQRHSMLSSHCLENIRGKVVPELGFQSGGSGKLHTLWACDTIKMLPSSLCTIGKSRERAQRQMIPNERRKKSCEKVQRNTYWILKYVFTTNSPRPSRLACSLCFGHGCRTIRWHFLVLIKNVR